MSEQSKLHVSRGESIMATNPNAKAERFGEVEHNLAIETLACAMVDAEIMRMEEEIKRLKKLKGLIKDHELQLRAKVVRYNSHNERAGTGHADLDIVVVNPGPLEYQALIMDMFPMVHEPTAAEAQAA